MKYSLLIVFTISSMVLFSQRYSGNFMSNYGGVYAIQENPATFVSKKPVMDINIIGTGLSFYTQYGYVANESLLSLAGKSRIIDASDSIPSSYNPDKDALSYGNTYTEPVLGLIFNQITNLPSFVLNIDKFSVGLFNNVRIQGDALNAPVFYNYKNLKRLIDYKPYSITPFNINMMSWGEVGLNLAYQHELFNGNRLAIGVNPKYLMGFEAMYFQNKGDYNFIRVRDTFISNEANVTFGFASGASKNSNGYNFGVHGTGFGADVGLEYMIPNDDEEALCNYKMKIGGAIKDLGSITFTQNAEEHNYVTRDLFNFYTFILDNRPNNYAPVLRLSDYVYKGNNTKSLVAKEITMYLPTAMNLHVDYNINDYFFLNAFMTRRVGSNAKQIAANNIWMLSGRYERRWFETGLSVSLNEDQWFGVGSYFRVGPMTIGSDHITTFLFSQPRLRGSDFYLNFRILLFGEKDKINAGFLGLGNLFKKKDNGLRSNKDDSGHWNDKSWNKNDKSGSVGGDGNSGKSKKAKCATYR